MVFRRHRWWLLILGGRGNCQQSEEHKKLDRSQSSGSSHHHNEEQRAKLVVFMSLVRRRLSWLVGAWLLCQIANVAAAPLTFCCQNVATAGDDEKCCPGLLPGQVCPMHHTKEGERTCKMRAVCAGTDASLVALAGGLGVMPPATVSVSVFVLGDLPNPAAQSAILRTDRPESPPPRA
jgi:hypothetical protein